MKTFSRINWFENVEERPHPWPGLNWLTIMLVVPDVKLAMNFYEEVFGIVPIYEKFDENDRLIFVRMRYRGCNFTLNAEGRFNFTGKAPVSNQQPPSFTFYLYVDDVDVLYSHAMEKGCTSIEAPYDENWGDRKARILDPFGYVWDIATART